MRLIAAAVLCLACAGLGAATVDRALRRHDPQAVLAALRPGSRTVLLTPTRSDTAVGQGDFVRSLRAVSGFSSAELMALSLRLDSNNEVAWFAALYGGVADSTQVIRFSGVFNRLNAEWMLVNAHLSTAETGSGSSPP